MKERIIIFDTTLRDGEQSLRSSLTVKEKLTIALSLEKLGVDIIEVGFPVSSPGDFKSVKEISRVIRNSRICGLARCINKDIDVAAESMSFAEKFRIHLFLGTSRLHIEHKLNKSFEEIIDMAVKSVQRACKYTDDVEFSCEDAGRTSIDNLCWIIEKVIKAGATTINIPDTVGYTIPEEFGKIIKLLISKVSNIDDAVISVHCHDDLGMAVANSISGVQSGARQIECTVNGIGERAGNAALEEVVMAINTRSDLLKMYTDVKIKEIYSNSRLVSEICKISIAMNKAIVGSNAFSHSSGIHQDGVLKHRSNYEIIFPESVGLKQVSLNLTSRSGRAAIRNCMFGMGYGNDDYDIDTLYNSFLNLADQKGQIFDYELEILAFSKIYNIERENFVLKNISITSDFDKCSQGSISLMCGNKIINKSFKLYTNPIDAVYSTLNHIIKYPIKLKKFNLNSNGINSNTSSQVDIEIECFGRIFYGTSISNNMINTVIQALIKIFNSIYCLEELKDKIKILKN
ncbi:MAG: 2-isopropylmalate synthase [Buchnera aphidicola (Eriosoma harunire)]